jgi:simple sugar transport system permease protein
VVSQFAARRELIPLTLLIILGGAFYLANPAFVSALNMSNMFALIPELGIIALGITLLMIAGEFDLSVGAVFAFVPLTVFIIVNEGILSLEVGFVVGLGLAALIGLLNGVLVTKMLITSFLVTLGMLLTLRGAALYVSDGFSERTQEAVDAGSVLHTLLVGRVEIGDWTLHASLFWFLALIVSMHFLLTQTKFGNWIMATGGNRESARARGIKTDRVKILLFVTASVLAAFAGLISAARINTAYPVAGEGYELEVIAMTVVGGTSLFGGAGTIIGTAIGVILLRSIRNGIIVVGLPGLAFNMFVGAILLSLMALYAWMERGRRTG